MRSRQEYIDILKSHADVLRTTYGIHIRVINDDLQPLLDATVFLIDYFGEQDA